MSDVSNIISNINEATAVKEREMQAHKEAERRAALFGIMQLDESSIDLQCRMDGEKLDLYILKYGEESKIHLVSALQELAAIIEVRVTANLGAREH